jgi:hypothetical protein
LKKLSSDSSLSSLCSLRLKEWWSARIARQKAIDASISAKAEFEFLYDKPYEDKSKVRVAGPFTVESVSPHRVLTVNENDDVVDGWKMSENKPKAPFAGTPDFASVILENLKLAGVQQARKEDRITFTSLTGWPGEYVCAEGRYFEGATKAQAGAVGKSPSPPSGERFRPKKISRIEPLNLIENRASVVGRSVAALPFGAFRSSGLPAGEIGSGRRHTYCLVTPRVWCSRWGGLSFR